MIKNKINKIIKNLININKTNPKINNLRVLKFSILKISINSFKIYM